MASKRGCHVETMKPVFARRLDPSVFAFTLSLHRHPYICISFSSRFIYFNKYGVLEENHAYEECMPL